MYSKHLSLSLLLNFLLGTCRFNRVGEGFLGFDDLLPICRPNMLLSIKEGHGASEAIRTDEWGGTEKRGALNTLGWRRLTREDSRSATALRSRFSASGTIAAVSARTFS